MKYLKKKKMNFNISNLNLNSIKNLPNYFEQILLKGNKYFISILYKDLIFELKMKFDY